MGGVQRPLCPAFGADGLRIPLVKQVYTQPRLSIVAGRSRGPRNSFKVEKHKGTIHFSSGTQFPKDLEPNLVGDGLSFPLMADDHPP